MSYWTVSQMSLDNDLTMREAAAYASEPSSSTSIDPVQWALNHGMRLAGQPGWDAAYSSALAAGVEQPGRDEAVITDSMILAAVQTILLGAGE